MTLNLNLKSGNNLKKETPEQNIQNGKKNEANMQKIHIIST